MQIGTKFSVSIHILLCVAFFSGTRKITSSFLAESVKTNPVVIRKLMGLLKEAGLIEIAAGTGGISLKKTPEAITFLDVFNAVESINGGMLFRVHNTQPAECPIARQIHALLEDYFSDAQSALEQKLQSYTLQSILGKITSGAGTQQ